MPPCNGCTGSTTPDCSNQLGVSLRQKLRQTTGGNKPVTTPFRHDLNQPASTKPGAVHL
ncbi:hypothetical protein THIX_30791 [Thiomonas sp. X19]|nr:hypothetical protein THIX_30791 [Thiomonas sp. X19]